jgi:membrane protein DedA with SNARE-associated domain
VIDALLRPLAYAGIGALVAGDALVPILPSEAGVIAGSAAAGSAAGIVLVLLIAWAGAVVGDIAVHLAGRHLDATRAAVWIRRRAPRRHGGRGLGLPVVFGRFLPGGRTAAAFAAGTTAMPWRRYLAASAAGGLLWAGYVVAIGRLGGAIGGGVLSQIVIGLVAGLLVTALVVAVVRLVRRYHPLPPFSGACAGQ